MTITLNGTTGITTPDVTSSGSLNIDASAPDDSLVVDASGNVGIGTSSPQAPLHVTGKIKVATGNAQGILGLGEAFGSTVNVGLWRGAANAPTTDGNFLNLGGYDGIVFATGAAAIGSQSERARIDSNGWMHVGVTSGGGRVNMKATTNNFLSEFYNQSGGSIGAITTNGSSTSYNTTSDYRLKEDWVAVADASTRVNALKPVNFAWKATGERVDGFLAHELAEVVPEAVTGEKDAVQLVDIKDEDGNVTGQEERPVYQGIDQSKLVPLLTAALQEALAEIETLKARVSALEAA